MLIYDILFSRFDPQHHKHTRICTYAKKKKVLPIIIIRFTQFQSVWLDWKTNPTNSAILKEKKIYKILKDIKVSNLLSNQILPSMTVSSEERKPLPPEEAHIWAEDHKGTKAREQYSLPGCRVSTAQSSSIPTVSLTKGSMKAQVTSLLHFHSSPQEERQHDSVPQHTAQW